MLKARHTEDDRVEIGVDEAGRGCLWGPLVAAAVVWPREADWTDEIREVSTQIRDSKQISEKRRGVLEKKIQAMAVAWGIGRVEAAEIDALGMTRANRLAFSRAIGAVGVIEEKEKRRLLIDGILGLRSEDLEEGTEKVEQIVEPKGDGTYLAIAAASILAKEGRDAMVRELCAAEPVIHEKYGLLKSKGYGTAAHRKAILEHGMHGLHRRLFLRKLLGIDHVASGESGGSGQYGFLEEAE